MDTTIKKAHLILEDGSDFLCKVYGADGLYTGELVFQTSQTGYQETITDPSYLGQMIVFTHPHIGNVGCNQHDMESSSVYASAIICRDISPVYSNYRAEESLIQFLARFKVPCVFDIDTRKLTQTLRSKGCVSASLLVNRDDIQQGLLSAKDFSIDKITKPYAQVATDKIIEMPNSVSSNYSVAVIDLGVKKKILTALSEKFHITVFPPETDISNLLGYDGYVLTNGPGSPESYQPILAKIMQLMNQYIPLLGICMGAQLMALSQGHEIYKLPYGHHGVNHPVQSKQSKKVFITSQNHNFAVKLNSCSGFIETYTSLFDGSLQGFQHVHYPWMAFQGHPEGGPGPCDVGFIFDDFKELIRSYQNSQKLREAASSESIEQRV